MPDDHFSSAGLAGAIPSLGEASEGAIEAPSDGGWAKPPSEGEYVDVILQVAARDASIARVLREICGLDSATRSTALGLVDAHLRTRNATRDVLDCIAMLRQDAVARRIAEVLTTPSSE